MVNTEADLFHSRHASGKKVTALLRSVLIFLFHKATNGFHLLSIDFKVRVN